MDVGVESDGHAIDAERPNRLVQLDLALLDDEALAFQLVRDVRRRHRPEELAFVAYPRREGERHLLELGGELGRRAATRLLRLLETLALLLDALAIAGGGFVREAARQQIVARVPGRDFHDVARMPELFNCLSEYDFHLRRFPSVIVENE